MNHEEYIEFTEIYQYVMPELPGINKPQLLQETRNVVLDLCRDAYIWQQETDPNINIKEDQATYWLDAEAGDCAVLHRILEVKLNDYLLYAGDDYTFNIAKQSLTLSQTPAADDSKALYVLMAMRPSRDATEMPCRVFDDYFNVIAKGVLAALKRQSNKSWSDPDGANLAYRDYTDGKSKARIEFYKKRTRREVTARPRHAWVKNTRRT